MEPTGAGWASQASSTTSIRSGCAAPRRATTSAPRRSPRLDELHGWLDHLAELGVNALYLGPVFESSTHGYDTADYYQVDRRLGDNADPGRAVSERCTGAGMRLILDGVFHHVGRDFWAFRDVQDAARRRPTAAGSATCDFGGRSPYGDPFTYEGWNGHYDLVQAEPAQPGGARAPLARWTAGSATSASTGCGSTRPTARPGFPAGAGRLLPRPAARLLADGRGGPRRLPALGRPRRCSTR